MRRRIHDRRVPGRVAAGSGTRPFFTPARGLFLLLLLLPAGWGIARDLNVTGWDVPVGYGAFPRGGEFTDTLRFVAEHGSQIHATEVDPTCECVQPAVTPSGEVVFHFDVLPEELDGPTEKLLYVFTDSKALNLLRVRLALTVLPDSTGAQAGIAAPIIGIAESSRDSLFSVPVLDYAVDLAFFRSPGCRTCMRIMDNTIPALRERWGDTLRVHEISLDTRDGYSRLLAVRAHYGVARGDGSFLVAVGDTAFQTVEDLYAKLNRAIENARLGGMKTYMAPEITETESVAHTRSALRSMSFWAVAGAGLLDGLNPCAFATIVFFISLLSYAGSTKRQLLIVGIGFTLSVFTVYLLLGLGAFRALQALAAYSAVGHVIWLLTILLLAVLILLSLRDTIRYYRTGQTRDALLQLPRGTKQRIHAAMRRGLKTRSLLLAAIGIGVTVTLFEAACTGQVYLPAIVLMLNDPLLSQQAVLYLVLYNLLFTAPLVVVFLLAYGGTRSAGFAEWSKRHYGLTRIALTLLFVSFLVLLLLEGV